MLLTSVFGPYARDDAYGSRAINPMELYHNQVTRAQGPFSPRMHHRSWGILMIQENISAPATVLDFPTREAFREELRRGRYDIVGISSIICNVGKVRDMCRTVREHSPRSVIVVGGHVAAIPDLARRVDADHIVRGDGIAWMRRFLNEDPEAPVRHPAIVSAFGHRILGLRLPRRTGATAATIIPSVGCPRGCNFCTTSAFFGGKGSFLNFYQSGAELFRVMEEMERRLRTRSFFIMDENFLLHRRRALELLEHMRRGAKSWEMYVFSSADALSRFTMEELVALGISWVWMGLESPRARYAKLRGVDTRRLVGELRSHGIKVLASTIIGLEHHTPENIRQEIEHAAAHGADFHQFMLYTPVPGTPLYAEMEHQGKLCDSDLADIHGQFEFNFRHPSIGPRQSRELLDWAFAHDYRSNGPSLFRMYQTLLEGWRRHRRHPDARVRRRFQLEAASARWFSGALLWAMEMSLRRESPRISRRIRGLRREMAREFGAWLRLGTALLGPLLLCTAHRESRRLARGVTYEPEMFLERRNWDPD